MNNRKTFYLYNLWYYRNELGTKALANTLLIHRDTYTEITQNVGNNKWKIKSRQKMLIWQH